MDRNAGSSEEHDQKIKIEEVRGKTRKGVSAMLDLERTGKRRRTRENKRQENSSLVESRETLRSVSSREANGERRRRRRAAAEAKEKIASANKEAPLRQRKKNVKEAKAEGRRSPPSKKGQGRERQGSNE
ncbi:hypothetical protein TGMAS_414600 [Toxoplasma gondii MAS]|uniref:Uncharacterized protein n=1 Tax=Toxoplasma gondii MAS TaxID=943118 RepID=A0A086QM05_TOXGO|nr:hypothetical protein TGMAS_414600 [Toxoplasma gondii MAS]